MNLALYPTQRKAKRSPPCRDRVRLFSWTAFYGSVDRDRFIDLLFLHNRIFCVCVCVLSVDSLLIWPFTIQKEEPSSQSVRACDWLNIDCCFNWVKHSSLDYSVFFQRYRFVCWKKRGLEKNKNDHNSSTVSDCTGNPVKTRSMRSTSCRDR